MTKAKYLRNILFSLIFTSLLSSGVSLILTKSAIGTQAATITTTRRTNAYFGSSDIVSDPNVSVGSNSLTVIDSTRSESTQLETQFVAQSPQTSPKQSQKLPRRIKRKVLRDASQRSGIPTRRLRIKNATRKTFGNPCVFKFGEICTREFNPIEGWEITVMVRGESVFYHANLDGSQIIVDPNAKFTSSTKLPKNLATAVLQDASKRSGIPVRRLKIEDATRKTFGNPCIFNFGEICTREFNPIDAWEVTVKIQKRSVIYRISLDGFRIAVDPNANL